jgi:hypothetical protein
MRKKEYRSVSKKMGLPRLKKATYKTCMERAKLIESLLDKNKVPKNLADTAQKWVYTYRTRARSLKAG